MSNIHLRKVEYRKNGRGAPIFAWFHEFLQAGYHTVAIIENCDGFVEAVDHKDIRFISPPETDGV